MILEEDMNVKIVLFPEGEDPDSFSKSREAQEVRDYIDQNATDFIKFKTNLLLKDTQNDPIKKASLIKDIVDTIALIPDGILRSIYIKECSTLLDVTEQTLNNHLTKELRNKFSKRKTELINEIPDFTDYTSEKQTIAESDDPSFDEKYFMRFLINYANKEIFFIKETASEHKEEKDDDKETITIAEYYIKEMVRDGLKFEDPSLQYIFDEFAVALEKNIILDESHFLNHPESNVRSLVIDIISSNFQLSENWEKKHNILTPSEDKRLSYFSIWYLDNFKSYKILKQITRMSAETMEVLQL